jgi:hypothetical protein
MLAITSQMELFDLLPSPTTACPGTSRGRMCEVLGLSDPFSRPPPDSPRRGLSLAGRPGLLPPHRPSAPPWSRPGPPRHGRRPLCLPPLWLLSGNAIGDDGVRALAAALRVNPKVATMNLSGGRPLRTQGGPFRAPLVDVDMDDAFFLHQSSVSPGFKHHPGLTDHVLTVSM